MRLLLAALLALALATATRAAIVKREVALPKYFPTSCARAAPDVNQCILKNIRTVMPHFLENGEQSLDVIPLEPVHMKDIPAAWKYAMFDFKILTHSIQVLGLSNMTIKTVRTKMTDEKMDMAIDVLIPTCILKGGLNVNGRVGTLAITGAGPWNATLNNVYATWSLFGTAREKDGEKHMKLNKFILTFTTTKMRINGDHLVKGGDGTDMTKTVLAVINQFWKPALDALLPSIKPEMEKQMLEMASGPFDKVPYRQLFSL